MDATNNIFLGEPLPDNDTIIWHYSISKIVKSVVCDATGWLLVTIDKDGVTCPKCLEMIEKQDDE